MTIPTTIPAVRTSPRASGLAETVGHTPLLPLKRVTADLRPSVRVLAKAEWFNPGGSIKDRPALNILRSARDNGDLGPRRRLLDSTSGNMGIAYATLGASLGIQVTLTLPANASPERVKILRALGAELILTDPLEGTDGAILAARQKVAGAPERYFYANQYDNSANWQAHFQTTGPEVLAQTQGEITHFVAGLGTTGTIMGTGRYLRSHLHEVKLVAVQPDEAFHGLEGLKHLPTAIQPAIYDPEFIDETLTVTTEEAYAMTRRLALEEGLFVGVSSGAAAAAALRVAARLRTGTVVTVFPDAGYKYLSEKLWEAEG